MNKSITPFIFEDNLLKSIFNDLINTRDLSSTFELRNLQIDDLEKNKYKIIICDDDSLKNLHKKNIKCNTIFLISVSKRHISKNTAIDDVLNFSLPLKIKEFFLRIENHYIQLDKNKKRLHHYKNYVYDPSTRTLKNKAASIRFTEKESEIFIYLTQNSNLYVSKKDLLNKVWSYGETIDTHTLETHLYSLRKKIEKKLNLKNLINFEENKGYSVDKSIL